MNRYVELGMRWISRILGYSSTLAHIGNENSGRYPRGSGERPYQHERNKHKEIEIEWKKTGEKFHLAEGEHIQNPKTFAGYGSKNPLDPGVPEGLSEQIGGDPDKWCHRKGTGVVDFYGEERPAEIHWFEEESVGRHKYKIKEWLDE